MILYTMAPMNTKDNIVAGTLYIVSTPIGNLEDITYRAVRILTEVAVIAAEDTRHTRILLSHYQIHAPLTSYHDFNKEEKAAVLISRIKEGASIALVSEQERPPFLTRAISSSIKQSSLEFQLVRFPAPLRRLPHYLFRASPRIVLLLKGSCRERRARAQKN